MVRKPRVASAEGRYALGALSQLEIGRARSEVLRPLASR